MDHPYRRMRRESDPWHFCVKCSGWPTANFEGCGQPPLDDPLCPECVARHASGMCREHCGERRMSAGF
ncbi:MAG: hypothetical protein HZA24_11510 [Nitrospirae bacterium]|nr:hypothetical protein [Nitrospirota bacterium]